MKLPSTDFESVASAIPPFRHKIVICYVKLLVAVAITEWQVCTRSLGRRIEQFDLQSKVNCEDIPPFRHIFVGLFADNEIIIAH